MEKKETLELVIEQLEERIAPGVCGCECNEKGNNGWGNGAEGTNNGSDEGGTASSKTAEAVTSGSGNLGGNGNHDAR